MASPVGLALTEPMPSMPVSFWAEPDGSWLRADYFGDYQGWPERRLDQGHLPRVVRRLPCVPQLMVDSGIRPGDVRRSAACA